MQAGVKWTPNTGPLGRGVFVKALPHFNRGSGNDSRPSGPSSRESLTEATSACLPPPSEDGLGTSSMDPTPTMSENEVGRIVIGESGPQGGTPYLPGPWPEARPRRPTAP